MQYWGSARKAPRRTRLTILTITEQVESETLVPTPTKFEIIVVELSTKVYEILRETQTRRFFSDKTMNHIHDPAALTQMNKALAELAIECGVIRSRQTEKGIQS